MGGSLKGTRTAPRRTNDSAIAQRRKALGMTQAQLAKRIGRKQNEVSRWELGIFSPNIKALMAIANVLNCAIEDLINDEEEQK